MTLLRALSLRHFRLAMALVALALAMKALLPAGYMIGDTARTMTIEVCHGADASPLVQKVTIPLKGHAPDAGGKQAKGECPFASLSFTSLAATDAMLLAAALVFIFALGFAPVPWVEPRRLSNLTPPLRGPPATP